MKNPKIPLDKCFWMWYNVYRKRARPSQRKRDYNNDYRNNSNNAYPCFRSSSMYYSYLHPRRKRNEKEKGEEMMILETIALAALIFVIVAIEWTW